MTRAQAPYMLWAKTRPRPAVDLAGSNLLACSLDDLPGARDALEIAGESPDGYPPLLDEIARRHGVTADRVATGGGCSGANFLACAAAIDPGDHVLVERPYYDPLPAAAQMLGASVSTFARRFEDGWDLDPDAIASAVNNRTRLLILSNPHNPTGTVASLDRLRAVVALAERRGFLVLVDEVYRDTVEDRPPMAAAISEACISSSSLTKAYGLASLRCGWTIASSAVTGRIRRARDLVDNWAPIPADRLSVIAFRNLDRLAARARSIVGANLRQVLSFLQSTPELECVRPVSTLALPRIRGVPDSRSFAERLFRETGVAVAPGHFFGAPEHFRIAFGGDSASVSAGLAAVVRCLRSA